ncbi:hypothetical protein EG343_24860 [Chryseobacterium nakagawai]|uniref:Uncharacterized protein n=1 Tax=Chryseobacterium nakagawai TaxID=1241982 RepID=A0AAD1DU41_CHRNA|nr:hypothetical protein [Chryseobacterium nakagawai]AZA93604.1 hypothetical protein EG343_24860 [Chryseobacterium nakagawai]
MIKNITFFISLNIFSFFYCQVGINTTTPQRTLHVNGELQITNELNVGGDGSVAGNAGATGQVLKSNGPGQPAVWSELTEAPTATGTVMVVDGHYVVAQEITVNLTSDFSGPGIPGATIAINIGNLNDVIIDNENKYTADGTGNKFQVTNDGVYKIMMNMQLSTTNNTQPVIGIWDNVANLWVARVNDLFTAPTNGLQTYTLLTAIQLTAGRDYSFRAVNTDAFTIKAVSSGATGSGPVSEASMRRLK